MAVRIEGVERGSHAEALGIKGGDILISLNGHAVEDVLDYRFYLTERRLSIELESGGQARVFSLKKGEYDDIGLSFGTYLMDRERRCKNNCVFCFIDQNPPGMRESIYFKDDDERLSFLFGNYVTLTNLTEREIERIISMRISPVNLSVHTMNPQLRVKMMGNRRAGEALLAMERFSRAGLRMNVQLVLVPGLNDGRELSYSLEKISSFLPAVGSVACVPVGLTAHRAGLSPLRTFTPREAGETIDIIESFRDSRGGRFCYPSDEFFLLAGRPIPPCEYYGEFAQLENGVGMTALFEDEFMQELENTEPPCEPYSPTVLTGEAAAPLISRLAGMAASAYPLISPKVVPIKNKFFGGAVTVAGLVTGSDILAALETCEVGDAVLFPRTMLRAEGDLFLDSMSPGELERALGAPFLACPADGAQFLRALMKKDVHNI